MGTHFFVIINYFVSFHARISSLIFYLMELTWALTEHMDLNHGPEIPEKSGQIRNNPAGVCSASRTAGRQFRLWLPHIMLGYQLTPALPTH